MKTRFLAPTLFGLALSLTALPLAANTLEGSIDGEAHSWHVLQDGDASTVYFSEVMPGMVTYTIQGHAEPRFTTEGTINLQFMDMRGNINAPEVSYFHTPRWMPNYGEATAEDWEFNVSDNSDGSKQLTGHFTGKLINVDREGSNPDDSMDVTIRFDVKAIPE